MSPVIFHSAQHLKRCHKSSRCGPFEAEHLNRYQNCCHPQKGRQAPTIFPAGSVAIFKFSQNYLAIPLELENLQPIIDECFTVRCMPQFWQEKVPFSGSCKLKHIYFNNHRLLLVFSVTPFKIDENKNQNLFID